MAGPRPSYNTNTPQIRQIEAQLGVVAKQLSAVNLRLATASAADKMALLSQRSKLMTYQSQLQTQLRKLKRPSAQAAAASIAAQAAQIAPTSPKALAGQLREQKHLLDTLQQRIDQSTDPQEKAGLQAAMRSHLKTSAAMVTAAKVKQAQASKKLAPYDIQRVSSTSQRSRISAVNKRLAALQKLIADLTKRIYRLGAGSIERMKLVTERAKLIAERDTLTSRLALLKKGKDRIQMRVVVGDVQREQILLPEKLASVPNAELVAVLVRYLASRMPRRQGEGRQQFLFRLRAYVMRALARYAANSAQTTDSAAAAEAAAVATITDDSAAIESEVNAGGIAADPAADAMAPYVDGLSNQMEAAAADMAPDVFSTWDTSGYTVPASPEGYPSQVVAAETPATPEQAIEQLDTVATEMTELGDDLEELEDEDYAWYKNPLLWAGAGLAAYLYFRR